MFDKSKYKNYYTIALGLVVLAIWGYNIFQFVDIAESGERVITKKANINIIGLNLEVKDTVSYSFSGNYRDPFSYSNLTESNRIKSQKLPQPESEIKEKPKKIKLPAIELTGIIEQTAIIKMPNNAIHFLEKGQKLKELQISQVWDDSVRIYYKNKPFTLKIELNRKSYE